MADGATEWVWAQEVGQKPWRPPGTPRGGKPSRRQTEAESVAVPSREEALCQAAPGAAHPAVGTAAGSLRHRCEGATVSGPQSEGVPVQTAPLLCEFIRAY